MEMSVERSDFAFQSDEAITALFCLSGKALWFFTALDFHIAHHIVFAFGKPDASPKSFSQEELEKCLEKEFKKTLGPLLEKFRECCPIPSDIDEKLDLHLKNRNWLCHRFYREAHLSLYEPSKLQGLFEKLEAMNRNVQDLIAVMDAMFEKWREAKGITPETMHKENRKVIEQLKQSDQSG